MNVPAMSDTALCPPRRTILVVGIVGVAMSVFIGADLTAVALIGGTTLAVFSMGHVERKMHPTSASRNDRNSDESAASRTHSTPTTSTETNHD